LAISTAEIVVAAKSAIVSSNFISNSLFGLFRLKFSVSIEHDGIAGISNMLTGARPNEICRRHEFEIFHGFRSSLASLCFTRFFRRILSDWLLKKLTPACGKSLLRPAVRA
jgi:hypothetical protein